MPAIKMQPYPRRDDYLAADALFPRPARPIPNDKLEKAILAAFERALKDKSGNITLPSSDPHKLVKVCIAHLKKRSDPILSPYFLSQCKLEEIFELDAVAHEMQRHRMKIGNFYQFLIIELMRCRFLNVADGKREGDVEAEIDTPSFARGLRLFISVKKSADTVGGQDVAGVIRRLESVALEDKNLTRPYLAVVCYATPKGGVILPYEKSRTVKRNRDGHPYSPNCEAWSPGFVFPFISGLEAREIYKMALKKVGQYFPYHALAQRETCGKLLAEELRKLGLVDAKLQRIDMQKFQEFVCEEKTAEETEGADADE